MNRKKTLTIIIIVIFLIAIGIGIFLGLREIKDTSIVFPPSERPSFPSASPQPTQFPSQTNAPYDDDFQRSLDQSGDGYEEEVIQDQMNRLSLLTEKEVSFFWTYSTDVESVVFFISEDVLYAFDGSELRIGELPFDNPYRIIQNKRGSYALVWFDNAIAVFDSEKKAWNTLESSFYSASFSPNGDRFIFISYEEGETVLSITSVNNLNERSIVGRFSMYDLRVAWVSAQNILLYTAPSYHYSGDVWSLNLQTQKLEKIFSGKGLSVISSDQGRFFGRFISSDSSTIRGDIFDNSGQITPFTLPFSTFHSKCVFSNQEYIYCGVPFLLNKKSGIYLPDSYLQREVYTKDELYRVNLETRRSDIVFNVPNIDLDVSGLIEQNDFLYFINRLDRGLYRFDIFYE